MKFIILSVLICIAIARPADLEIVKGIYSGSMESLNLEPSYDSLNCLKGSESVWVGVIDYLMTKIDHLNPISVSQIVAYCAKNLG